MVEAARSNLEHSCSWNKRQFQIGLTQGRLQWHHQYLIYSVPVHIHHLEAQEERAIIWQILITMSDLEKACGDVNVAQNLRDQARAIVNDIAEDAGEMQDVFFSQPAVVQLLGK